MISLFNQSQRRKEILAQCYELKLDVEIYDAVEGVNLTDDFLEKEVADYPASKMTLGVIGCALSHRLVYERLIEEGLACALILEDDARIDSELINLLKQIELNVDANKNNVYLLTAPESYYKDKKIELGSGVIFHKISDASSTMGYVVTQRAARSLINANTPIRWEADLWVYFNRLYGINTFCRVPHIVKDGDSENLTSTLQQDRSINSLQRGIYRHQLQKKARGYQFKRLRRILCNKFSQKVIYQ
ncbi:glycosyltransferase family 25 protein [Serratia sp. M24T3]|uniref:glycosyltransferase family 25 protein n=1 Tax=Serratia sp. M24T3 TaxID=932213 RepID=UPI00210134AF|nr:glycosyltransferase family 25 protein [Serratia sp. M24T3]